MAANYSLASAAAAAAVVSLAQLVMTKSMSGLAIAFASRCFSFTLGSVIASTRRTELYSVVSYELCIDHINDWSHDRKYLHFHRFVSHVTLSLPPSLSLSLRRSMTLFRPTTPVIYRELIARLLAQLC